MLGKLWKRLFSLSPEEATYARRGFPGGTHFSRARLEQIGRTFLLGYHLALEDDDLRILHSRLQTIIPDLRGFAFEGAAMALTLLDYLTPWRRNRLASFLRGPGSQHIYMIHVGAGWALARLPVSIERALTHLDSCLRWLAIDGYGFHEGYFYWKRYLTTQAHPRRLSGYGLRAFDQGLGRSLWFIDGADTARIPQTVASFPASRQADLWSGVGLACAYAGGADYLAVKRLRDAAGEYCPQLAQGAAFGAKARQRAGNPTPHTELACELLCGVTADEAAHLTDEALFGLSVDGNELAYELWRCRIQSHFRTGNQI